MRLKLLAIICLIPSFLRLNAQVTVIQEGQNWLYYDQGDVGTSIWKNQNFDASTWNSGNAEFGYGDGDENTLVSFGPSSSNKHITTYFRKQITLPYISSLSCRIKIDDAAVVYLDGIEVFRNNMPTGNPSFGTLALNSSNENAWYSFTIPASATTNLSLVFAVEIHQAGAGSSDMSFDFEAILEAEPPPPNLYINEIMASNDASILDNKGEASDWIEIYSSMPNTTNLKGYFFTDDKDDLTQFEIENDILIGSSGYKIFWASGETNNGGDHLNFKLSSSGEWLALVAPDGLTIVDSLSFGEQKTDVSYGLVNILERQLRFFSPSSPVSKNINSNAYLGFLSPPIFSHEAGYYENDFDLNISSDTPGVTLIYSIDGSRPSLDNTNPITYTYKNNYPQQIGEATGPTITKTFRSYNYSGSIRIKDRTPEPNGISRIATTLNSNPYYFPNHQNEKINIIKAVAIKEGYIQSSVSSSSFLHKLNGQTRYNLPIISLGITEKDMFDYYNGIGVAGKDFDDFRAYDQTTTNVSEIGVGNFYRRGQANEIEASFEYFEDQSRKVEQNVGIRIHGNVSRHYPQKSLRIFARSEYGKSHLEYPFFKELQYDTFKRLIIRNGGDYTSTRMRDAVLQKAVSHLNFETQAFQPVVLYLNSEYWGLLNLRERFDDDYFELKYGIPKDEIDIIDHNATVVSGENSAYLSLINYLESINLQDDSKYNVATNKVDTDNLIDYQSSEIFFGNYDWPQNNVLIWRKQSSNTSSEIKFHDGRWRWAMLDIDNTSGTGPIFEASYDYLNLNSRNDEYKKVFHNFLKNSEFQNTFILRNADLLNSAFKASYINALIEANTQKIDHAMIDQIKRWTEPLLNYNDPVSKNYWLSEIEDFKDWISERGYYHKLHIKQKFGITGETNLVLDVSNSLHGHIKINTIEVNGSTPGIDENPYPWTGVYFKNIENKLIGIPKLGYKFSHWTVNGQQVLDDTLSINTTASSVNIECFFEENLYSENLSPMAYSLSNCEYEFLNWDEESPAGTYPYAMKFVYMNEIEPTLTAAISDSTFGKYDESSRTRINGLNEDGVSFINTGNLEGNPGYPGGKLGGLILAINTQNVETVKLSWTGRTIEPNERDYAIRLQYRVGDILPFQDFLSNNTPVEYSRQSNAGDSTVFANIDLPAELIGKPYVQLLWRYYSLNPDDSGPRPQLAIDDIKIETIKDLSGSDINVSNSTYSKITSSVNIPVQTDDTYKASKSISLIPGFNTSGTFSAEIKGCPED